MGCCGGRKLSGSGRQFSKSAVKLVAGPARPATPLQPAPGRELLRKPPLPAVVSNVPVVPTQVTTAISKGNRTPPARGRARAELERLNREGHM